MDKEAIQKIIDVAQAQLNDRGNELLSADPIGREIKGWLNAHKEMLKTMEAEEIAAETTPP